jgi:pSer/pThr/pTyr-binding forkhead associated (FHA) protein
MVICPSCGQWVEIPDSQGNAMNSGSHTNNTLPPQQDFPPQAPFDSFESPPISQGPPSQDYDPWTPTADPWLPAAESVDTKSNPSVSDSNQYDEPIQPPIKVQLVLPDNKVIELTLGKYIIGRQGADILINDPSVSRRHCIVEVKEDPANRNMYTCFIADIGFETGSPSTNGVYLSHRSLRLQNHEQIPLYDGTIISLGSVNLLFTIRKT